MHLERINPVHHSPMRVVSGGLTVGHVRECDDTHLWEPLDLAGEPVSSWHYTNSAGAGRAVMRAHERNGAGA